MSTKNRQLSIESLSRGPITFVRLYGVIDETFDPAALIDAAVGRDVILNLKAVSRISSFGVRDWVHTLETLRTKVDRIFLVDCSPAVVAQLNMIANFAAGASVASVEAPFYCEKCGWDTGVSVPLTNEAADASLPQVSCKRCRASMRLTEDPETYFAFRKGLHGPALDASVKAFIAEFSRAIDGGATEPETPVAAWPGRGGRAWLLLTTASQAAIEHTGRWARQALGASRSLIGRHRRLAIALGAGFVVVVGLLVVVIATRTSEISAKQLTVFREHVTAGHYAKAEELLGQYRRDGLLTKKPYESFTKEISDGRLKAASARREAVAELSRAKKHAEVVAAANRPIENAPLDVDSEFLLAEAYRALERCSEALPHYATFESEILKSNAADKRLDDAVFWQGDCALKLGRVDVARRQFLRVAHELPRGDYRTSALARLKTLDKK